MHVTCKCPHTHTLKKTVNYLMLKSIPSSKNISWRNWKLENKDEQEKLIIRNDTLLCKNLCIHALMEDLTS